MKMARNIVLFAVFAFAAAIAFGFDHDDRAAFQTIFLTCRHRGDPLPSDDLSFYAEQHGLSNKEMSTLLLEFVKNGMDDHADKRQQRMGRSALQALSKFGGEAERCIVLDIMRVSTDLDFRAIAIKTSIRMMPEEWESVVREVATNERFSNYDRFIAYEEAFRVGKNADEETKERLESVLKELAETEPSPANQDHLRKWTSDLKAR